MKSIRAIFLLSFALLSCKKDELVGEYEIFQGKWVWVYSEETIFDPMVEVTTYSTTYTEQGSEKFNAEFLEKGKVKFQIEDNTIEKFRIIFNKFSSTGSSGELLGGFSFLIFLDNNLETPMSGSISQDTLIIHNMDFPIKNHTEGGLDHSFKHFYVRK